MCLETLKNCLEKKYCLILCAVEKMAAAHAGAAKSPAIGGAASPPRGAAEVTGNDEQISRLHRR